MVGCFALFLVGCIALWQGDERKRILFFGDSLTAGYGLSKRQAYPAFIQKKLDTARLSYQVVNAGLSGETSAGGKRRIHWVLKNPVDVFVLALGANDALRGVKPEETEANLSYVLAEAKRKYPRAKLVIAGMKAPPNMGRDYVKRFERIFTLLSKKYKAPLLPFMLEGVAGEKALNLPDGIHPNQEGHKRVAELFWKVLKKVVAP